MSVQKFAIASFAKLGRCYGLSRQGVHYLSKQHGAALTSPDELFSALVATGRKSKLRSRLSDPAERARISKGINTTKL